MNFTNILKPLFALRLKEISLYDKKAEELQANVFWQLIQKASHTEWGEKYKYATIRSYQEFQERVPLQTYDDIKPFVERMRHGEKDVLWPSTVKWYAKSSGTTNDKSKFIPVSKEILQDTHYAGGRDCVSLYLASNPNSQLFDGKGLILGGSHSPNYNLPKSLVGDLSAILIENINPLANLIRTPSKEIALMSDFETKMRCIAESTLHTNITNISGVPSWMLAVLKEVLANAGEETIEQVWPNLEVFFHGGVCFTPYLEQYKQLIKKDNMHYMETYNASEGFFGCQNDLTDPAMLLMIDYGVFYEFIPFEELEKENPEIIPLTAVEVDKNYAMVISTSGGLWRYLIGDTVRFTQKSPYKFIITGRTKHFINAFGEELIVDNAEKGLAKACRATGALIRDYSAAPVFMDAQAKCRHQWLIEFEKEPASLPEFAELLDQTLQTINSDYEAKRSKNITLQPLEIIVARKDLFHDWLKEKGKLGGQHKIPRLSNTREYLEQMLEMNK